MARGLLSTERPARHERAPRRRSVSLGGSRRCETDAQFGPALPEIARVNVRGAVAHGPDGLLQSRTARGNA